MKRLNSLLVAVALVPMYGLNARCASAASKETFNATVSYVLKPSRELPEGVHQIAILDQGIKVEITGDEARAKKWAKISADMMEQMVLDAQQNSAAN